MITISAIVITKNEERCVAECLSHLRWADQLVVVDSFSSDRTVEIAKEAGAEVYQRHFLSFPRQRNAALALANSKWVLFVDADEIVTAELSAEVRKVVAQSGTDSGVAGYWVPRKNIIWGKWIRGGGWYPDRQMRLLRHGRARYDEEREVHEVVKLEGDAAYLRAHLIHRNYDSLDQFFAKQDRYSSLEARSLLRAGFVPRRRAYVTQPLRETYRRFIQLGGYRDGLHGLMLAVLMGYYELVALLKLRQSGVQGRCE